MTTSPVFSMALSDWLDLSTHFLGYSLMAVGGAMSPLPEMQRYLVGQQHWLNETQFNEAITLAQAAPGPNVLYVALLGWTVGQNAGGLTSAVMGALLVLVSYLLPCLTLAYLAGNWAQRNRDWRVIRAFKQGMGPIVIALMIATGWVMASANKNPVNDWPLWLMTALTAVIVWRSQIHLLWLLAAGALLGGFGLI